MLNQRLLVIIALLPLFVLVIAIGGWPYNLLIAAALAVAAWEYWRLFKLGGYSPSPVVLIGGVAALAAARAISGFAWTDWLISALILLAMAVHVFMARASVERAALNFCITLAGVFYIGWLGSYLISVRSLPDGTWWLLLVLTASWATDSGAYLIGSLFGRHPFAPLISPRKTWEGFLGGLVGAALITALLGALWNLQTPAITAAKGLVMGLSMAVVTPLGDLGESLIKRQFGVKDSGRLFPGHGGMLDRIDTWIWAAAIGFYMIALWI